MFNILFVDEYGNRLHKVMDFVPRNGDTISAMHYKPSPKVRGVILFPEYNDELKKYIKHPNTIIIAVG